MKARRALSCACVLACAASGAPVLAQDDSLARVAAQAERIVENFRRTIVLHEAAPANRRREATVAGQFLFYERRRAAAALVDALLDPGEGEARVAAFSRRLREAGDWRDPDRLALAGIIAEVWPYLNPGSENEAALRGEMQRLERIRAAYNREITGTLADRAPPSTRPEWRAYVAFVQERYGAARILEELGTALARAIPGPLTAQRSAALDAALRDEWTDGELPPRALLLTFDDGPHPRFTPQVLDILDRYGVKAVFFLVGQNLGAWRDDRVESLRNAGIVQDILRRGHAIGNHSHTHPFLPRLDELHVAQEIDAAEELLAAATGGRRERAPLFRPPYGARNALVLADVAERGLRSVLWNIDSRDWADPVPRSIAQRVLQEAEREGRGIVLFHDVHLRTVEALPIALEALQRRGFSFARWDGQQLVTKNGEPQAPER